MAGSIHERTTKLNWNPERTLVGTSARGFKKPRATEMSAYRFRRAEGKIKNQKSLIKKDRNRGLKDSRSDHQTARRKMRAP